MKENRKFRLMIVAIIAVVALVFLASGLSQLELLPGRSWEFWWQLLFGDLTDFSMDTPAPFAGADVARATRIISIIILILLPFAIIAFILYPDVRKRMLREFLRVLVFLALAYAISTIRFEPMEKMAETLEFSKEGQTPAESFGGFMEDLPEFERRSPPWFVWVTSFLLAVLFVAVISAVGWSALRRKNAAMLEIAQEAQSALDALQAGADLRNTIIRCYQEMSEVLQTKQGIRRDVAMTPREFELSLTERGLPDEPVQVLTRLFEAVRYGAVMPGEYEEDQAITSLRAIVAACQKAS